MLGTGNARAQMLGEGDFAQAVQARNEAPGAFCVSGAQALYGHLGVGAGVGPFVVDIGF